MVVQRVQEDEARKTDLGQRHSFMDAFKDGRVWALAVVYFCGVVCFYAVNFWMPTIIQELGIDKKDFLKVGPAQHDSLGRGGGRDGGVGASFGPHRRAALALRPAGCWSRWSGCSVLAIVGHAPIPSIIALTLVTVGHPVVGGDVLVAAHGLPVGHGGRRRNRLDQLGGQSRRTLRPGPDRAHPHGDRRRAARRRSSRSPRWPCSAR